MTTGILRKTSENNNYLTRKVLAELEKEPVKTRPQTEITKRLVDVLLSLLILAFFAPLMLIIALLIKATSRGPVLFKQTRVGLNGELFTIYKFRTMKNGVGDQIHQAFMKKVIQKQLASGQSTVFKMKNDPRITTIGKILRKTSLDELPQVFNVLSGTMSLIGPRPPIEYEVKNYQNWQLRRLAGKPGITGWWQVNGRNHTDFETMVKLDLEYLEKHNLLMDLKIVVKTIPAMLKGY